MIDAVQHCHLQRAVGLILCDLFESRSPQNRARAEMSSSSKRHCMNHVLGSRGDSMNLSSTCFSQGLEAQTTVWNCSRTTARLQISNIPRSDLAHGIQSSHGGKQNVI